MLRCLTPVQFAFVVLPLVAGLLASPAARAQEDATPSASPAAVPPELQHMVDAINATDSAALAALYTEDGIHEDIPAGVTARGREEIAAFIEGEAARQKDVALRPTAAHEGDGWAVIEYVFAATDAASGVRLEVRGATVFEMEGGLIRRSADYYAPHAADQDR